MEQFEDALEEKMVLIGKELDALFSRAGVKCATCSLMFKESTAIIENDFQCSPAEKLGLIEFAKKNIELKVDSMLRANMQRQAQAAMAAAAAKAQAPGLIK